MIRKGALVFLVIFFAAVTSFAVHECIHIWQIASDDTREIEEICFLGFSDNKENHILSTGGWIEYSGEELSEEQLYKNDVQAYLGQIIYFLAILIISPFFIFTNFTRKFLRL